MTGPGWPEEPEVAASPAAEDQSPEAIVPEPPPWEDPARPRLSGYFQTLAEVMRHPAQFFARPAQGGVLEPFAFGLITGTAGGLLGLFWWLLLLISSSRGLGTGVPRYDFLAGAAGVTVVTVGMALMPLVVVIKLALASLWLWIATALLGSREGLGPIWRLCCYATAASTLAVVPFFGSFLVVPLALFILHQGLRGALGMSGGRALGTLAIFLVLQTAAAFGLTMGFLGLLGLLGLLLLG